MRVKRSTHDESTAIMNIHSALAYAKAAGQAAQLRQKARCPPPLQLLHVNATARLGDAAFTGTVFTDDPRAVARGNGTDPHPHR
jgi:hypothetical protein